MARLLMALCLGTGLAATSAGTADAYSGCTCMKGLITPEQRVNEAATVFSATVTDVEGPETRNGGSITATLHADHVYRGGLEAAFKVSTSAQSSACGYEFTEGVRYLVSARAHGSTLTTGSCSGNMVLPTGARPLRLSDRTEGMEPLTPELLTALGTPTRVSTGPPPAPGRTGPMMIAMVTGVFILAGVAWAVRGRFRAR